MQPTCTLPKFKYFIEMHYSFQVMLFCVDLSGLECWMRAKWSSITFWVWRLRISWKDVCKHKSLNLVWPKVSIMLVSSLGKDTLSEWKTNIWLSIFCPGKSLLWCLVGLIYLHQINCWLLEKSVQHVWLGAMNCRWEWDLLFTYWFLTIF